MTKEGTELLPCPFCSGEAEIERKGTARQSMIYVCSNCGARRECGDVFGLTKPEHYGWNDRPTPSPPAGAGTEPAKYDAPELEIVSRDRQIAYLRHQAEQLEATVAEQAKRISEQREQITALLALRDKNYWIWQGDETDHLESLGCHIIIHANQLRAQISSADGERKRLRTALEGVLNSAVHPDIALRAVMVDLIPIRSALGSTPPTTKEGNTQQ